jgi:hypothetical protein
MVGEEGPEVVRFQRSGRVFPTGVTPPPISPSASPITPVPAASPSGGRQAPQPAAARPAARANAVGVFNYSPTFNVMGVSNAAELVDLAMRDLRREVQDLWQGGMFDNDMRPA